MLEFRGLSSEDGLKLLVSASQSCQDSTYLPIHKVMYGVVSSDGNGVTRFLLLKTKGSPACKYKY